MLRKKIVKKHSYMIEFKIGSENETIYRKVVTLTYILNTKEGLSKIAKDVFNEYKVKEDFDKFIVKNISYLG